MPRPIAMPTALIEAMVAPSASQRTVSTSRSDAAPPLMVI
jgi:hypothetical protein